MKKLIALIFFAFFCLACKQEPQLPPNTYQVNVTAPGIYNGMRAHLNVLDGRRKIIAVDTAMVLNEAFSFAGETTSAAIQTLTINGLQGDIPIIIEPGVINIEVNKDDITKSTVEGPSNNQSYQEYQNLYKSRLDTLNLIIKNISTAREANELEKVKELRIREISAKDAVKTTPYDFILSHPDSDVSLLILDTQTLSTNPDLKQLKKSYDALTEVINRSPLNQRLGQKLNAFIAHKESQAKLDIGKVAPEFSAPDKDGNMLALKDMKGKATIIDFWAAWCGPCRRENPNVVKIYEKYHDKGLEIIGVSLDGRGNNKDSAKAKWLKAVEDDGLNWHHVSSLKYFNDPVARLYKVNAIPATFILDKNGVIVAKKLRGQALEDKIKELLE